MADVPRKEWITRASLHAVRIELDVSQPGQTKVTYRGSCLTKRNALWLFTDHYMDDGTPAVVSTAIAHVVTVALSDQPTTTSQLRRGLLGGEDPENLALPFE